MADIKESKTKSESRRYKFVKNLDFNRSSFHLHTLNLLNHDTKINLATDKIEKFSKLSAKNDNVSPAYNFRKRQSPILNEVFKHP